MTSRSFEMERLHALLTEVQLDDLRVTPEEQANLERLVREAEAKVPEASPESRSLRVTI